MHIIVHVAGYYDWEPLPPGVQATEEDVKAKRVKPGLNGAVLMRVPRKGTTHTTVALPEQELGALIVADMIRDRVVRTRADAVAHYLARLVMPHHAHPKWIRDFEVSDDGADESAFRALVATHVAAGNIEAEDVEDMVAAYLTPIPAGVDHLRRHFKVARAGAQGAVQ